MSEYIRREDAIKAFCESCNYCNLIGGTRVVIFDNCPFTEQFRKLPKAVVEEKFTGKWIWRKSNIKCSICGYEPAFDSTEPLYNYCPFCGARMVSDG